ncbi:UNVERIFIED_CONTAM: hypothetical protein HDU68_001351 [Siphonaria sp. JEL0065]|nr:hypothetical protein HDU68_001351 [Siphonaria sp. JEL0065]
MSNKPFVYPNSLTPEIWNQRELERENQRQQQEQQQQQHEDLDYSMDEDEQEEEEYQVQRKITEIQVKQLLGGFKMNINHNQADYLAQTTIEGKNFKYARFQASKARDSATWQAAAAARRVPAHHDHYIAPGLSKRDLKRNGSHWTRERLFRVIKRKWKRITVNYKTPGYSMSTAAGTLIALPVMKVLSILKLLPKSIDRRWFPRKKKRSRLFSMPLNDEMFGLWKLLRMYYFVSMWALFVSLIWNWKIGIKYGDSALGSTLSGPKPLISMVDWSKLFTNGAAPTMVSNYESTYSHETVSSLVIRVWGYWSGVLNIQCGDSILDSNLPRPIHLITSVDLSELFINGAVLCVVSVCRFLIRKAYSHLSKARIIELGNHVAFMANGDTTD